MKVYQYRSESDLGRKIGDFVHKTRSERGINQTKFAKKANLPRSSVFNIEQGLPSTMSNVDKCLKALELTWADMAKILDGSEK